MRRWLILILAFSWWLGAVPHVQAQGDGRTTIHIVQRGETLYRIALNYGTSVEAISQTNGLVDTTSIQVGQRLLIPSSVVNAVVPTAGRHVVQPGESLAHIALRYGTTPELITGMNSMVNPDRLYVGQLLDVSETAPGHPTYVQGQTYIVQPGDTLYAITLRAGLSLGTVLSANNLVSPSLIFPGQRLLLPESGDAPALQVLPAPLLSLDIAPLPAEVGRTIQVRATAAQDVVLSGTLLDRALHFAPSAGLIYKAYYGVHAFTAPGLYPLTITVQDAAGNTRSMTALLQVADGHYESETITLPPDQASLLDPAVDAAEYARIQAVMSGFTAQRYFDGPMGLPAAAPVTSPFGIRRSYNGGPYDRFHTGTDFGGPPGSSIFAPAAGMVVFSEMLQVRGLTTIIDHGWGVYTGYWHQSETNVTVGQVVQAGDILGTIGNTGRSTGAHLHWEMWVNGVEVDPLQWARFSFP